MIPVDPGTGPESDRGDRAAEPDRGSDTWD
jgi:hypothetical protein